MTGGRVKTVDYDNNTHNYIFTGNLYLLSLNQAMIYSMLM